MLEKGGLDLKNERAHSGTKLSEASSDPNPSGSNSPRHSVCSDWDGLKTACAATGIGSGMRQSRHLWKMLCTEDQRGGGGRHSQNEGFCTLVYRKGNSVKRSEPFSESPDSHPLPKSQILYDEHTVCVVLE